MSEQSAATDRPSQPRIAVYVCQCGGNIGDYVDTDRVIGAVKDVPGVRVARHAMFTCSDTNQQEMIDDVARERLDGFVVACCSPKLHTFTFRGVAERAGVNPYRVTQVNIREQCSWTHTDNPVGATTKAIKLVRAGIERALLAEPLEPISVTTDAASRRDRRRSGRHAGCHRSGRHWPRRLPDRAERPTSGAGWAASARCSRAASAAGPSSSGCAGRSRAGRL